MIHIGKLIEAKLQEHGTTKAWLAQKLYCHRTNVNDIIRRSSIDTDLLLHISKILDFNFFVYYTDELINAKQQSVKNTIENDKNTIDKN
ncbi:MAG: XRE family transcriptional regulator [Bacteroidales bacterium]|nr:XRE family transcriptional regulator [Bacteroidales bacterium]